MAKISINLKEGALKREEQKETIIGIDLGTTNSLVAYIKNGLPETIVKKGGSSALVPSIVHLSKKGKIIVGEKARNLLISDPDRTIYSVKRLLGKSYQDIEAVNTRLSYKIHDTDQGGLVKVQIDNRFYSPVELSAEILKELKKTAEEYLNDTISKAVITVPAYFNDAQRQATRDAGKLAGLDVLRIVNEPTAASLAYDIGTTGNQNQIVAVYDLGGGTFDISILNIEDGVFEVLATNGDTYLGGDDFDKAISDYWILENKISKAQLENVHFNQKLRLSAEEAKKILTEHVEFKTEIEGLVLQLTRSKFEELIHPLVDKTIDLCRTCVKDSGKSIDDYDEIIMVGGSTRTPLVKQLVASFFNKEINDTIDPDRVVAMGAAVQADILAGNRKDMLLLDITPLSLGIETIGGLMDTIIPRNTKIPTRAGRQYTTSVDGQTNLKVAVFQGERDLVSDNRKLGEFILKGIPPMAAGMPKIDIQFIIDADGILRVKAKELRSNVETEVSIKSQYGISEEEMAKMLLASMQHAQSDMEVRSLIEAKNEAQNVITHGYKFIDQNKEIIFKEEKEQLERLIQVLENEIINGTKDDINLAMERLNEFSRPIAERALDYNISKSLRGEKL